MLEARIVGRCTHLQRRGVLIGLAAALLIGSVSTAAHAQAYKGRWKATSTTAISVTGDVTIDTHKITFAGARKPMVLDVKLEEARPGRWLFAVTGSKTGAIPLIQGIALPAGQLKRVQIGTVQLERFFERLKRSRSLSPS